MNAGFQFADHWTHDEGGRIIGEACHIIDLFEYLAGAEPISVSVDSASSPKNGMLSADNKIITITFKDGSVCSLLYTGQGSPNLNKEYLEVHFDQKSIILDDYSALIGYGLNLPSNLKTGDKGHEEIIVQFGKAIIHQTDWPIPYESLIRTTQASFIASKNA